MDPGKIVIGIILAIVGVLFFLNNKQMSKGAFKFYRVIYTQKNLAIMFRVVGIILVVGGALLIFLN